MSLSYYNSIEANSKTFSFYFIASITISLSSLNYIETYFNNNPFFFTESKMNYLSDYKSYEAYYNASLFYLIASITISLSDYNYSDANFKA